jgi:hypothetical protein
MNVSRRRCRTDRHANVAATAILAWTLASGLALAQSSFGALDGGRVVSRSADSSAPADRS